MSLAQSPRKQSGFTLIELIIVMAIVAILATAGLAVYTAYIKGARDSKRVTIANQMKTIVEAQTTISGAPIPADFEAYLEAEGIAWNVPIEEPLLARVVESLAGVFGISDALALINDPAGGKAVCLDHEGNAKIVCQFVYYRFSDGTYAVSYGVEKAANLVNPHYSSETGIDPISSEPKPRTYGSFIGNSSIVTATPADPSIDIEDQEVPAIPNLTVTATSVSNTHEYVNVFTCGGATCGGGQSCVNEECTDLCGESVCTENQSCISDVCTDLCGGKVCAEYQSCVIDECIDLCGGDICIAPQTCVGDVCTDPDPCTVTPTVGTQCADGTVYVSANLRTTESNEGSMSVNAGVTACSNKGAGWRLPILSELQTMCNNRDLIGNFPLGSAIYWSSTDLSTGDCYDAVYGTGSTSSTCDGASRAGCWSGPIRCVKSI